MMTSLGNAGTQCGPTRSVSRVGVDDTLLKGTAIGLCLMRPQQARRVALRGWKYLISAELGSTGGAI